MSVQIDATHEAMLDPETLEVIDPGPEVPVVDSATTSTSATPRIPRPTPIPRPLPRPIPIPIPFFVGSRVMIWKQDPSVRVLGRRLAFLPGLTLNGPRNSRIDTQLAGTTPVIRNTDGDFLFPALSPESDCVHTYSVVDQVLRMWQQSRDGAPIRWAWNAGGNRDRLECRPRGFTGANAFYSRTQQALSFGSFVPSGQRRTVFTCRSLDIVAHEAGHAILDGLKPGWLGVGNVPQTGGLHESFGDLSAVFLALSQFDQVEAFVALSKANLHDKTFLAAVGEEFGAAIGRSNGLRNADNDLKLSEVANQVHALSQVFTGAIYDVMADIFAHRRVREHRSKEVTQILFEVAQHLRRLLLDAIVAAPDAGATFADVANAMLRRSADQGDPAIYRHFIRNRFRVREIVTSAAPLRELHVATAMTDYDDPGFTGGDGDELQLEATDHVSVTEGVRQDRSDCCGTMQLPEYALPEEALDRELALLRDNGESTLDDAYFHAEFAALDDAQA